MGKESEKPLFQGEYKHIGDEGNAVVVSNPIATHPDEFEIQQGGTRVCLTRTQIRRLAELAAVID